MRMYDLVWTLFLLAATGYGAVALLVTALQRRLIYMPDQRRATPADFALKGVEVVSINAPDGAMLVAWYNPAPTGGQTLLYFHGNRGYVHLRAERMADLQRRGFGVLMLSYRGFGGSTGAPSEVANVADGRLAYDWLRQRGVASGDIVVFGESLGTAVATQVAGAKVSAGLVLDSPYTSMTDIAQQRYPWLPVRYLLWDRYETIRHIKRVTVPVLIIHGETDDLVPCDMGRAVHRAVLSHSQLHVFQGAGHLEHCLQGSLDIVERWCRNLAEPVAAGQRASGDAQSSTATVAEPSR